MLCRAIGHGRMVTRMTNREFLNTLVVVDSSMEYLGEHAMNLLISYPSLEGEFLRIRKEHQYFGNLQILRLILIKHIKNKDILENLCLLEYVAEILDGTEICRKWINNILYACGSEIGRDTGVADHWSSIKFIPHRNKKLQFGELVLTPLNDVVLVKDCNEESSGLMCTGYDFCIANKELTFTVERYGEIEYTMRLGKKGLYADSKRKNSIPLRSKILTVYKGYIECTFHLY